MPAETDQLIDDEVAIAEAPMMRDEQRDRRIQVFDLVGWWWVRRNEMVAVQHDALIDALGERFGKRRLFLRRAVH